MGTVINKYFLCSKCSFQINSNRVFFFWKKAFCVSVNLYLAKGRLKDNKRPCQALCLLQLYLTFSNHSWTQLYYFLPVLHSTQIIYLRYSWKISTSDLAFKNQTITKFKHISLKLLTNICKWISRLSIIWSSLKDIQFSSACYSNCYLLKWWEAFVSFQSSQSLPWTQGRLVTGSKYLESNLVFVQGWFFSPINLVTVHIGQFAYFWNWYMHSGKFSRLIFLYGWAPW